MNFKEYLNNLNTLVESKGFVEIYNKWSFSPEDIGFAKFSSGIKNPDEIPSKILKNAKSLDFEDESKIEDNVIAVEKKITKLLSPHFLVKFGVFKKRPYGNELQYDVYSSNNPAPEAWFEANKSTRYVIRIVF